MCGGRCAVRLQLVGLGEGELLTEEQKALKAKNRSQDEEYKS